MRHLLSKRQNKILRLIVEEYIKQASPVGSSGLCKELDCSSATIRNEMASLEEMGFLEKTHTSSGRVPSEKGYRYYVDNLMEPKKMTGEDVLKLQRIFDNKQLVLSDAITKSMEIISEITNCTSVVLGASSSENKLKEVQVVPLDDKRVVAIVITDKGHVEHKELNVGDNVLPSEVKKVVELINKLLVGTPLDKVSSKLEFEIKETLSGLYHYQKIQFDDELSNKLRQIITEQYAKNPHFKDTEIRAIFEKEMQYAWVRIIRKPTNEEIIRDVRASYRDRFLKKLTNSKNIAVAAIFDRNNTPIGCILTGNALSPEEIEKQQNQSSNKPQEFTNTGEHKPPNSSKKSLSQQKRYINDFERSHLFLEAFNQYRKSFNKPDFEFCQEFLNIAKQYSKSCGEVQTILNPNTFIEKANQINGVSNVKGFGIQAAKHSNYVDRAMEEIKQKYNDIILSDSNKISIGYWNNEFGQVFISFFIGDLVQNE